MTNEILSIESGLREIVALDRVIHEPARTLIMAILYTADVDFLFLLRETGLTKGNLSSHLTKLEGAGYIAIEKTFVGKVTRTICRQTETGRQAFLTYREQLRRAIAYLPQ
jgi:DNA-binding transcriptional ArsR family regulator